MSYGASKGIHEGDIRAFDFVGMSLASALGVIGALALDFFQKGDSSAVFALNVLINETIDQQVPLGWVMIALILAGGGAAFFFEPTTKRGAFGVGAGLLATVMAALPVERTDALLVPMIAEGEIPLVFSKALNERLAPQQPGITATAEPRILQVQRAGATALTLSITYPNGLDNVNQQLSRGQIVIRLHDEETKRTWDLLRTSGTTLSRSGNTLILRANIPLSPSGTGEYHLRVETPRYAIFQEARGVPSGATTLNWSVTMQSTNMPLSLQRLRTPYSF